MLKSRRFADRKLQEEYNKLKLWEFMFRKGSRVARDKISCYFNNFSLLMPGSAHRDFWEEENIKEPLGRALEQKGFRHSQLYLNQTQREFYKAIDNALKQEGLYGKAIEFTRAIREPGGFPSGIDFLISIIPVWFRLRERGYSHRDLF